MLAFFFHYSQPLPCALQWRPLLFAVWCSWSFPPRPTSSLPRPCSSRGIGRRTERPRPQGGGGQPLADLWPWPLCWPAPLLRSPSGSSECPTPRRWRPPPHQGALWWSKRLPHVSHCLSAGQWAWKSIKTYILYKYRGFIEHSDTKLQNYNFRPWLLSYDRVCS